MSKTETKVIDQEEEKIITAVRSLFEEQIKITTASGDLQSFSITDLSSPAHYSRYEKDLVALCKRNPEKVKSILNIAKEKFVEREKCRRHVANVENWMVEVMKSDLEHGKLKGDDLERQIEEIRREGSNKAFQRNFDNIEEDNRPPVINGALSASDRNKINDKRVLVKDNLRINSLDLEGFLKTGKSLTSDEKKALRTRDEDANKISNFYESLAHQGLEFLNSATRGIISESNVVDDKRFKDYHQKRSDFVMGWAKRNPAAVEAAIVGDVEANLIELERSMEEVGISADEYNNRKVRAIRGRTELAELREFLHKKTQEMESQDGDVDAQLQEEFNKQNEQLLHSEKEGQEGLNTLLKKEDDNHKWRIACGMMLLSALAPQLLLLGPLANIVGPILSQGSLPKILAGLLEIDGLGFVTQFMKLLNLAEYAEYALTHCPVIGNLLSVMDGLLFNSITSNLMDSAGNPFIASPLFPLMIAGAFAVNQGAWEILHHDTVHKSQKYHSKQQKDLEKQYEGQDDSLRKERSESIAKQHFDIMKKSNLGAHLVQFMMKMKDDPDYTTYLETITMGDGKTLKDLLAGHAVEEGKLDIESGLLGAIKNSPHYQKLLGNFLMYEHLSTPEKTVKDVMDEANGLQQNSPAQAQEIATLQQKVMDDEFVREKARDAGMEVTPKTNVAGLQDRLISKIESDINDVFLSGHKYARSDSGIRAQDGRNLAKTVYPQTSPKPLAATEFMNGRPPQKSAGVSASAA